MLTKFPLFRDVAIRRYSQSPTHLTAPDRLAEPTCAALWLLTALLIIVAITIGLVPMPTYVVGRAVVVTSFTGPVASADNIVLVAILPPATLSYLRPGNKMVLESERDHKRWISRINTVEPQLTTHDDVRRRHAFGGIDTGQWTTEPAAVVLAPWSPANGPAPSGSVGSVLRVTIEAEPRRIVSLFTMGEIPTSHELIKH